MDLIGDSLGCKVGKKQPRKLKLEGAEGEDCGEFCCATVPQCQGSRKFREGADPKAAPLSRAVGIKRLLKVI